MRQIGRSVYARGGAALAVMAAGIVVAATHDNTPVAQASTLLVSFKDADVVSSSGATHAAVADQQLVAGDVVTTGPNGYAQLATRGRLVLLSSAAALAVVDGSHQQLRTGTAVVDARTGPGVILDVAGDSLAIPDGSATEAARGVSVRIGALHGPAGVSSTNGRRLALPALSQTVINGAALPTVTTPLHLADSDDEARVVPQLVAADLALNELARGIDTTGGSTARAALAGWNGVQQPIPNHTVRSERVLPVLIADATHGGDAQQRYDNAVAWRAQGGSWGVVLQLLDGRVAAVESKLASLQQGTQTPGEVGTITPAAISDFIPGHSGAAVDPQVSGSQSTFPTRPVTSGTPITGGTPTTPAPNLLGSLVSTVQSVLDGVLNLLPHDTAATSTPATTKHTSGVTSTLTGAQSTTKASTGSSTKSTKSVADPTRPPVATASNGLLGDLLGGLLNQY